MHKNKVPKRLWDFGSVYESELLSRMARGRDRRTGYEEVTGDTADISEWLYFEMYDLVYWIYRPKSRIHWTTSEESAGGLAYHIVSARTCAIGS